VVEVIFVEALVVQFSNDELERPERKKRQTRPRAFLLVPPEDGTHSLGIDLEPTTEDGLDLLEGSVLGNGDVDLR